MAGGRRQPALVRAVNALMRALGSTSVRLRIPVANTSGVQRELGIAESTYQEAQVAPVVVRHFQGVNGPAKKVGGREEIEVLISPAALDDLTTAVGIDDGWTFLRSVEQVAHADRVFSVTDVSADRFAGLAYMYRVTAVASTQ